MYDIFLEAFRLVIINLSQDESSGNEIINLYCFPLCCNLYVASDLLLRFTLGGDCTMATYYRY